MYQLLNHKQVNPVKK